ncbi:MAG: PadR family transcriptional regulator [Eubacteriales bacterium]|nr:PadR family transcriptional regulator [Eubacteriales bacterium]
MNTQFKKGVLEICVLSYLAEKDFYGYELVESLSAHIHMSEGTIYPLLRRFSNDGLVETYLMESQSGPPRKYYRLTQRGQFYYNEQLNDWMAFSNSVNGILRRNINE